MHRLSQRANIRQVSAGGKSVILYEDHRTVIDALYHARQHKVLSGPCTLACFDYHDDAKRPGCLKQLSAYRATPPSQPDLHRPRLSQGFCSLSRRRRARAGNQVHLAGSG